MPFIPQESNIEKLVGVASHPSSFPPSRKQKNSIHKGVNSSTIVPSLPSWLNRRLMSESNSSRSSAANRTGAVAKPSLKKKTHRVLFNRDGGRSENRGGRGEVISSTRAFEGEGFATVPDKI